MFPNLPFAVVMRPCRASAQVDLFAVDRHDVFRLDRGRLRLLVRALVDDRHFLSRVDVKHVGDPLEQGRERLDDRPGDRSQLVGMHVDQRSPYLHPFVPRQLELAADGAERDIALELERGLPSARDHADDERLAVIAHHEQQVALARRVRQGQSECGVHLPAIVERYRDPGARGHDHDSPPQTGGSRLARKRGRLSRAAPRSSNSTLDRSNRCGHVVLLRGSLPARWAEGKSRP